MNSNSQDESSMEAEVTAEEERQRVAAEVAEEICLAVEAAVEATGSAAEIPTALQTPLETPPVLCSTGYQQWNSTGPAAEIPTALLVPREPPPVWSSTGYQQWCSSGSSAEILEGPPDAPPVSAKSYKAKDEDTRLAAFLVAAAVAIEAERHHKEVAAAAKQDDEPIADARSVASQSPKPDQDVEGGEGRTRPKLMTKKTITLPPDMPEDAEKKMSEPPCGDSELARNDSMFSAVSVGTELQSEIGDNGEDNEEDAPPDMVKRKSAMLGKRMSAVNDRCRLLQKAETKELSVDESPRVQESFQQMRNVEYSDSSDEDGLHEVHQDDSEMSRDDRRARRHIMKRSAGLSVVSRTKVLRGIPNRLQVLFARQLQRVDYPIEVENEIVLQAGDNSEDYREFVVLDDGTVDVLVPLPDGTELFIGRLGPGSLLGGTRSLGLSSNHLMTFKRSYTQPKARLGAPIDPHQKDELPVPIELTTFVIHDEEILELEDQFHEELDVLRSRVLSDLHCFVVPHLQRLATTGFFRGYCSAFVRRVVKNMDMRICRSGELIFKESTPAQSMAVLFCGWIDILIGGKLVATQGEPGMCFGESALLEDSAVRGATVRCSTQTDCLICLLQKNDFLVTLNEFPEEKLRLEEQVKMKLTRLSMQSVFTGCDINFLDFLAAIAESVELEAGQVVYGDGTRNEELLMLQRGDAVVLKPGQSNQPLQKGACTGYQAAIGLRHGPPDYAIRGGERGCLLIRITHSILSKAFVYFPGQVAAVLKVGGMTELPDEHAFTVSREALWGIMTPLLSQAFHSMDFDIALVKNLAPFFKCEVCDPGCTITEENAESSEMVLLLHGQVSWSTAEKVSNVAEAPRHFDEGIIIGTQRRQTATIVAKTTCVIWLLSAERVPEMKNKHFNLCKVFEDAATLRRSVAVQLQARLRNMKTFRRFRSEILELISQNLDIRTFLPGEMVFEKNEVGTCMYILLRGRAQIVDGKNAHLDEGSTFGEMCMFGQVRRTMSVQASTMCVCNVVDREIITYAFNQFPEDQLENAKNKNSGKQERKGVEIMNHTRVLSSEDRACRLSARKKAERGSVVVGAKRDTIQNGGPRYSVLPASASAGSRSSTYSTSDDPHHPHFDGPGKRISTMGGGGGPGGRHQPTLSSHSEGGRQHRGSQAPQQRGSILTANAGARPKRGAQPSLKTADEDEQDWESGCSSSGSSSGDEQAGALAFGKTSSLQAPGQGSNRRGSRNDFSPRGSSNSLSLRNSRTELDFGGYAYPSRKSADMRSPRNSAPPSRSGSAMNSPAGSRRGSKSQYELSGELSGPTELERRFQHHSRLFHTPAPKLPPANADLYRAPKEAEQKLSRAFRNLMPPKSASISASVHGVPGAGRSGLDTSQELSRESVMSITGNMRSHRVWPTYTDPLPPLQQQVRLDPATQAASVMARPRETECKVAVAAQLQLLASSLLRIHTKPQLNSLDFAEVESEAEPEQSPASKAALDVCYSTWSVEEGVGNASLWGWSEASTSRCMTAPTTYPEKRDLLKSTYLAPKRPADARRRRRRPGGPHTPKDVVAPAEEDAKPVVTAEAEADIADEEVAGMLEKTRMLEKSRSAADEELTELTMIFSAQEEDEELENEAMHNPVAVKSLLSNIISSDRHRKTRAMAKQPAVTRTPEITVV